MRLRAPEIEDDRHTEPGSTPQVSRVRHVATWRNALRGLLVAMLVTTGATLTTATPAAAAGGCNGKYPISACVDWGSYGNRVRADFYMNADPSDEYHSFKVWLNVNGSWYLMGSGRLDHKGNYCCWYRNTDSLPNIWYTVYSEIDVYNSSGSYRLSSTSPSVRYVN
ncbi:hypothetical protein [Catellatospora sp. NPDC049133]|jgi:hypothetical protein|uniref:hypothetical protein n=1 Tax=Catellatospora sp. NPDC049133 TaxID=3155499 RepID=UPI0033CA14B5